MTLVARIILEDENGVARIPWLPDATDTQKGITIVDNALSSSSENPVQNKVIYTALSRKANISSLPANLSDLTDDLGSNPEHTHRQYLTAHQDISDKETASNKVTSLSAQSTDTQYPSAKCVYDLIGNVETLLQAV